MNKLVLFTVLVVAYFATASAVAGTTCPQNNASYANCSTCNSTSTANAPSLCYTCNSGNGLFAVNGTFICSPCDVSCANCTQAFNSTQCVASNDTTQATNSAAQTCAVINTSNTSNTYASYQTYTAGAFVANSTNSNYTYSCFSCPVNCTNCSGYANGTLPNGTRAVSAVQNCTTCQTGTAFVNSTYIGCFVNGTSSGSTSNSNSSSTGTGAGTTTTTLPATASCVTTDSNGNCTSCPTSYVAYSNGTKTICQVCSLACLNCRVPNDATQCVNSNISAYNNASSATPCGNHTYPTQTYLAGAVNSTYYNYACYACPYNCTDCTLTNGSKPISAITQSCKTCANGTSFQSGTYNGINGTACLYSTSFSTIKAGLTIGAVMTILLSLLI